MSATIKNLKPADEILSLDDQEIADLEAPQLFAEKMFAKVGRETIAFFNAASQADAAIKNAEARHKAAAEHIIRCRGHDPEDGMWTFNAAERVIERRN
tara:strand:+ start:3010 stop:3303 length:294 start_codon:yes stop_codon:yes gene_type:complete